MKNALHAVLAAALLAALLTACQGGPKTPAAAFRDLNKNGRLDPYENPAQLTAKRVDDLLSQMNLEEKAGSMFITGTGVNSNGSLDPDPNGKGPGAWMPPAKARLVDGKVTTFNVWMIPDDPKMMATWANNLQKLAEQQRLGIPVTIASDPRNHFSENIFSVAAKGFSLWPEPPGLAAIGDEALVERFADIFRQEYRAVGIHEALHPQIDLATEPRWARINGNFSEDADLTSRMVRAYLKGMKKGGLRSGVAAMAKHFPGGGPQNEGLDPHFPFQKGQVYPGGNFDYHLRPFEAAFAEGVEAVMPYYGIPVGQTGEEVGMSFNKAIITGLLREKMKFDGVVCTDWGLITDNVTPTWSWPARAWGVEKLSRAERVQRCIEAGVDQFGGESCPELVVQLVKEGKVAEARIDQSVRRIMRVKFEQGLFDDPFVDVEKVGLAVGNPDFQKEGEAAQRRSITLLKNDGGQLPLKTGGLKIFAKNIDSAAVARFGQVVGSPKGADLAIIRIKTPWVPVKTDIPMAQGFHHGDLDFKGKELADILALCRSVPTVVDIYLDRPAVIPEVAGAARALVANYGASDAALLDVLFGNAKPEGRLPFELPSSMAAVRAQKTDVPYDSEAPLFKFGAGLSY